MPSYCTETAFGGLAFPEGVDVYQLATRTARVTLVQGLYKGHYGIATFCKAFLEATGVLVERSIFLITSLPKVV